MLLPVILSGGVGSRLWPLSREAHPKPFIKLDDGESLLQKTYNRAVQLTTLDEIVTVTNRELFFYTKDEFEEGEKRTIKNTFLLEPVGRNSAAAIGIAAQYALTQYGPDCILLVMPADHLISNTDAFTQAVEQAQKLATNNQLVTFGIKPTYAATGYGYILADRHKVKQFVEKPNLSTAKTYLARGNYFWNSGMFCMNAGSFLKELSLFAPDIAQHTAECVDHAKQSSGENWQQYEIPQQEFARIQSISVDYAIFEKSKNVATVACDIGWSDIGSWSELGSLYPKDDAQNAISGKVICEQTQGCVIHSEHKLVATVGIDNLIIADTTDALLVADKNCAQDVRIIVDRLKAANESVYKEFPTVHRPWGTYTVLQEGEGFKLKRIEVKPAARLSLQSHKHRSEHWVVVSGKALITNGEELLELEANQSTYIPAGNKHRLENRQSQHLVLIEIQCGDYLGEDDIVRYDDVYGRTQSSVIPKPKPQQEKNLS